MIANKEKPVIENIVIPKEKLAELNKILNSGCSRGGKKQALKNIAGGCCSICGSIPDKIVKFKSDDASIVERYCDSCFERWTEGKDQVRLTATNGKDETIAAREKNSHLGD